MITISTIKNSAGAATYFSKEDNYYLSEVDAKENSVWRGIGADKLKLSNKKVLKEDLQEIMEGRLPNGVTIGSQKDGKDGSVKHRPGYNICFNAPKSVSILALDGDDKRFYDAHLEAVKETLKTIEKDCAQARVHNGEKVSFENTKNLTIALIKHTASRSLDPHLHHHALVMNATEKQDKTWKALSSNKISKTNKAKNRVINGFSERIYHNQIYYGLIYRSALANKVKDLGCEIEMTGKHGMWEIKGVPKEAREAMSKRRKEIEELLDKLNYHSFKAADLISAKSRDDKPKDIDLAEMKQTWKKELANAGFSSKEFLAELEKNKKSKKDENSKNNQENKNKNLSEDSNTQKDKAIGEAIKTVKDATWYLSQYKLKLDYTKIISQALEFSIGKTTHKDIVHATTQLIKDGFLISLNNADSTFVTKELIETEKTILDFVDNAKNKWPGIAIKDNRNIIANEIKESEDKKGKIKRNEIKKDETRRNDAGKNEIKKNKKHAIDILQSKHRISLIESNRPDNRDLIANILELSESSGKTVRVLSPNRLTTNDINENIKRKPDNLWQWLISLGKPEVGESIAGFKHKYKEEIELPAFLLRLKQGKDVVAVNGAETLGCDDIKTLLELTEKSKAKVIFLQDTTDKRGFGAGNPIETLKQAGIERFKIDAPKLNTSGVTPKLIAIKNDHKRALQLAEEYAERKDKDRKNTLVLANSKNQLKTTNDAIRNELKKRGKISDSEYSISVLNPVYMSKPEAIIAHKYQQGMIIRFYDGVPDDWNVEYCDRETNTLRLIQNKRRMAWNPKKQQDKVKYGVFKKETIQIAKGDKLIATSNMYDLGIKNGTKFTVGEAGGKIRKSIELLFDTGEIKETTNIEEPKKIKMSLADLKNSHFQYDYATTINKFSKKPVGNIIADFKAYSLNKPTINELIKQAKESLTIFTNDSKTAQKRLGHIPVKLTAAKMLLDTSKTIHETDNKVTKTLDDKNNKTIAEIKSNLEEIIGTLKNQYEFRSQDERKAVDFAIEKITSRNAGFTNEDLEKEALEYALKELISKQNKKVTLDDIKKTIEEKHVSGILVMGENFGDGVKWTTKEMLRLERSIIADLKKGNNKLDPLLDPKTLKIPTEEIKLTKDQKNAISLIATTKDQHVIVQGYAGTGKTTMFSQVHKMLKEKNDNNTQGEIKKVKILGLAPTHKAVKELKAIGIKAQSLKSFLIEQKKLEKDQDEQKEQKKQKTQEKPATRERQKKQGEQKDWLDRIETTNKNHNNLKGNILDNKLIILDEISMVSNKEFAEFVEITGKSKSHVVLSGDVDQYPSIGSGKPVEIAQRSNILKIAFLREIIRQKNPELKKAVKSTINGNYSYALDKIEKDSPQNHIERINPETNSFKNPSNLNQSDSANLADLDFEFFKNLQKSIIEIDNNELKPGEKTLEQMVAEDFLTRTPEIRDETVIIVHANKDRTVINKYIRDGLKKQGVIKKTGVMVDCLTAKGLTDTEHKSLTSYNSGNVVKLANKYYHVTKVDLESKSLLLEDGAGKTRYFYPEKETDKYNIELYSHTKEELAVGDAIRLTKSDKKRGLFANFEYQVKAINEKQVILESKDGNNSKDKGTGTGTGTRKIKEKSQIILNHKKLKDSHWDYAQTVTGHGIQGGSKKYVIAFEVSYRKFLANVRSFYISISRAIEHIAIYTDDKSKFLKQLLRNSGDKYSALEITGELEKIVNSSKQITKLKEKLNTTIYDVKEIRRSLENQAETIVERLLGRPNKKLSSSKEWRYGNKGSLVINMTQDKRGLWKSFETGESGNLISLLQKELGLSFPETLKYASNMFGDFQNHMRLQEPKINKDTANTENQNKNTKINSEKSKTSEYAQKLAKESLPITGTIVEKYLKEHRGIKNTESDDIRYHPKVFTGKNEKQKYLPSMLSIGRDKNGNVQCVQATYLDPKTANKADLTVKKRTYASPSGALVSLQKHKDETNYKDNNNENNKNKISFVAEGTETGLSIKDAITGIKNSQVVVTLGKSNFNSIDPKRIGNQVIFCLDNDGPKTFTDNTIHKAAKRLIDLGKEVFIAIPKANEKNNNKVDFNDITKTTGTSGVKNMLENSIPYKEWINVRGTEINPHTIEKVMQPKNTNFNSQGLLSQKPEINLDNAIKFIDPKNKNSFDKYLNTYDQMQHSLSKQRITDVPKIDIPDTQKDLSKIEKELY